MIAGLWIVLVIFLFSTDTIPTVESYRPSWRRAALGPIRGLGKKLKPKQGQRRWGILPQAKFYAKELTTSELDQDDEQTKTRPLKVLFLSSDTGGGHRASAEALAKQLVLQFPGSTYELVDLWTDHGVAPYRLLVPGYQVLLRRPWQWRLVYHFVNAKPVEMAANFHAQSICCERMKKRIQSINPDVIVSVHPTMNHCPLRAAQLVSQDLGKHIPFFTVVTDLGSGHATWFDKRVDRVYVASERLYQLAMQRGGTPADKIVRTGLPIRHEFAIEAEQLGDRMSPGGQEYQRLVKQQLGLDPQKPMVLVMAGGEGMGRLSDIADECYAQFSRDDGMDVTICIVCGRNDKLRTALLHRDWESMAQRLRSKVWYQLLGVWQCCFPRIGGKWLERKLDASLGLGPTASRSQSRNVRVEIRPLGFVTNMPEYMVAADILLSKAGPGTISEAASVGLPVLLTGFLPGQEAGNVDVVLEGGFGDYSEDPKRIAQIVREWLQDEELLQGKRRAAQDSGRAHAAQEIARDIGMQTMTWMEMNEM